MKRRRKESLSAGWYPVMAAVLLAAGVVCLGIGSEYIAPRNTVQILWNAIRGIPETDRAMKINATIILSLRLPRVLCAGLIGAALSLCGAAMQGLLRNPLADGGILGVSSGGALGAALAIITGITIPGIPMAANVTMAMVFSFGSLMIVMSMAYSMDRSLATHTIILTGVIFSMLASALYSLLLNFAGNKLQTVTFLNMGSLNGRRMNHVLIMLGAVVLLGGILLGHARELNHFALGEENARRVGVPVKRVKLVILIAASALIGVCVAVGGNIAFVGLIVPHMVRLITGPNHRKLMPAAIFAGAVFLMLTDLLSRSVLKDGGELPIGAVTSVIGAVTFAGIFRSSRRGGKQRVKR